MNLLEDKNKKLLEKKLHEYAIDIKSELIHISFLLSFSGGLDSMVIFEELIRIRKKYPFILGLAHINHNMHNQSKKMENFCKKVARKNNIPIYVDNLQFPSKKNFESTARKLRYRFLNKVSKKYFYNFILTAHHKDDQLETIFMKEMEGGDWTSKIGIREKNKNIRRPFLDVFKKDIVLYAENKQLLWIEDPSNKDISFKRNNIRHIVFPNAVKNDVSLIKTLINIRKDSIKKMNLSLLKIDSSIASMLKKTSLTSLRLDRNMLKIFTPEELKILIYRCIVKKINTKFTNRTYGFWTQFYIFIKESNEQN